MAEVHVLTIQGRHLKVAMHVPIPNGNNAAGVSWQTALINSGLGGTTVLKDGDGTGGTISSSEKTNITNGSVFERVREWDPGADFDSLNAAGKNARVDAFYNLAKTELQDELQKRLNYCGYTRTVP